MVRSKSAYSLGSVSVDNGPIDAEPLAAFFCSYPEIINPCNAFIKFWHSEVLLLYKVNGRYGLDLFDRGGMVKSRKTAVFFHTKDPNVRLRWHHVRAIRMDPGRGFWFRYRQCFRHVDLSRVPATMIRDVLAVEIQTKLHPEGFNFRGHCCYNFAHDLMTLFGSLNEDPKDDFKPVHVCQTTVCPWCYSVHLDTYMRRHGYGEACDDLAAQERDAIEANRSNPYHGSAWCCIPRPNRKNVHNETKTADKNHQAHKKGAGKQPEEKQQQHHSHLGVTAQHMLARSLSKASVVSDLSHSTI